MDKQGEGDQTLGRRLTTREMLDQVASLVFQNAGRWAGVKFSSFVLMPNSRAK
jgi:hypothetical protein